MVLSLVTRYSIATVPSIVHILPLERGTVTCPCTTEFIVDIMVKGLQSWEGFGAGELAAIERGKVARMFAKCSE
jgi:hypothetical protein